MASDDGPFGSNSVLVVDLKAAPGGSQFNVGAALWQVALTLNLVSHSIDPMKSKIRIPSHSII
jgi:hypothetical protein